MEAAVIELVKTFTAASNSTNARAMRAYLKDNFPFLGIKAPERNQLYKKWKSEYLTACSPDHKLAIVRQLWKLAEREYRYVAIEILTSRKKSEYTVQDILLLEELIVLDPWWDTVDLIASNAVGVYFRLFPEQIGPITTRWMLSQHLWLQRTCLLFQLKYGKETDFRLLTTFIDQVKTNREFFIQKAIGWSLRQYAKTRPESVRTYLTTAKIDGLALREASKYIN